MLTNEEVMMAKIKVGIRYLSITENTAFRRYKNNIIHSISFSISGFLTEMFLCQRNKIL